VAKQDETIMNAHRKTIFILVTVLVLLYLVALIVLWPGSETETTHETIEIGNNDFWWKELEKPPDKEGYGPLGHRISVKGLNATKFDVYILWSPVEYNYSKYNNGEDFTAEVSRENINDSGTIVMGFDHYDDTRYLVVDNWDNGHAGDAHANENITVIITQVKVQKFVDWRWDALAFGGLCCGLPVLVLIAIAYLSKKVRSGKRPPPDFRQPPGQRPLPWWQYRPPYMAPGPPFQPPQQRYPPQEPPFQQPPPLPPQPGNRGDNRDD